MRQAHRIWCYWRIHFWIPSSDSYKLHLSKFKMIQFKRELKLAKRMLPSPSVCEIKTTAESSKLMQLSAKLSTDDQVQLMDQMIKSTGGHWYDDAEDTFFIKVFKIWKIGHNSCTRAILTLLILHYRDDRWSPHRSADWGLSDSAHFKKQGSNLPTKTIRLVPQYLH